MSEVQFCLIKSPCADTPILALGMIKSNGFLDTQLAIGLDDSELEL